MTNNNHYTLYVLNAIASIKQHIDDNPLHYRTCKELLDGITTVNRKILEKAFKDLYDYRIKEYHVKQRLEISKNYLKKVCP